MNRKGVTSKGSEDLNAVPLDFESISCLKTKSLLRKTIGAVRYKVIVIGCESEVIHLKSHE